MGTAKNRFHGKIVIENLETKKQQVADIDLPALREDNEIIIKSGRECTAGGQLSLKSTGGWQSCEVSVWGSVSCTHEDFFSGYAHGEVFDHLREVIIPVMEDTEDAWLPEDDRPKRLGFEFIDRQEAQEEDRKDSKRSKGHKGNK